SRRQTCRRASPEQACGASPRVGETSGASRPRRPSSARRLAEDRLRLVTRRAPAMLNGFAPNPDVANPADGFLLSEIYNPIVVAAVTPRVPPPYARDRRVRVARLHNGLLQYRPGIKLNSSRWRLAV